MRNMNSSDIDVDMMSRGLTYASRRPRDVHVLHHRNRLLMHHADRMPALRSHRQGSARTRCARRRMSPLRKEVSGAGTRPSSRGMPAIVCGCHGMRHAWRAHAPASGHQASGDLTPGACARTVVARADVARWLSPSSKRASGVANFAGGFDSHALSPRHRAPHDWRDRRPSGAQPMHDVAASRPALSPQR